MTLDGAAMSPLELTVMSMSGKDVAQLRLSLDATVLDAKKEVAPKVGLNRFRLRLVFGSSDSAVADTTLLREFPQPLTATLVELPYETDPAQVACMCKFAHEDNVQEVEKLLNVPISPDAMNTQPDARPYDGLPNAGKCTALMAAAAGCHVETIKLLCEAGASVDKGEPAPNGSTNKDGYTPLVCCCLTKHPSRRNEALRILLGFSVSRRSRTDALNRMVSRSHRRPDNEEEWQSWRDTVQMLCDSGADLEEHNELWQALMLGDWRMAKLLKEVGATPVPFHQMFFELFLCKNGGMQIVFGFLVIGFAGVCKWHLANRQVLASAEAWVGVIFGCFHYVAYGLFMGKPESPAPFLLEEFLVHFAKAAVLFAITSVTVALEMSAADDLIHVGDILAKPQGLSIVFALFSAIAAVLPIFAAVAWCAFMLCISIKGAHESFSGSPDSVLHSQVPHAQVPYMRYKFTACLVMIPGTVAAGWYMHNAWMRLGDTRHRIFTISVIRVVGILFVLCGAAKAFKLFPHAVASLKHLCCCCLARPRKVQSLQEPLL